MTSDEAATRISRVDPTHPTYKGAESAVSPPERPPGDFDMGPVCSMCGEEKGVQDKCANCGDTQFRDPYPPKPKPKAVCPKDPTHKTFTTVAHVSQVWVVDEDGNWLATVENLETVATPNTGNIWECIRCGAEAKTDG